MKYKVGDLVVLSAAGKLRKANLQVRKGFGIIIEIDDRESRWPINCHWVGGGRTTLCFKEYEVKRYKP